MSKLDTVAEENQGDIVEDGEGDDDDEEGDDDDEDEDDDDEELEEEDLREIAQTLFDDLRGTAKTVTIAAVSQMPDVQDLIEDGLLNQEELTDLINDINNGKKDLNFEQFFKVVSAIDAIADQAVSNAVPILSIKEHSISNNYPTQGFLIITSGF